MRWDWCRGLLLYYTYLSCGSLTLGTQCLLVGIHSIPTYNHTHTTTYVCLGLAEDTEVGTLLGTSIFHASVVGTCCLNT
jgi:hypothetical protein